MDNGFKQLSKVKGISNFVVNSVGPLEQTQLGISKVFCSGEKSGETGDVMCSSFNIIAVYEK